MQNGPVERYIKQYNSLTKRVVAWCAYENKKENVVISPLSIITLLAMAAESTSGKTKEEISDVLGGDLSYKEVIDMMAFLQNCISDDESLVSSNAAIVRNTVHINTGYREKIRVLFGGELFNSSDLADDVNSWVSQTLYKIL